MPDNQLMRAGGADASIYAGYGEQPNALLQIGAMQQLDRGNVALQSEQHALALKRIDTMKGIVGGLAANPNATRQDYIGAAGQAVTAGLVTRDQAIQLVQQIPQDPAALRGFGQKLLLDTLGAESRYKEAMGEPTMVDDGGSKRFVNVNRTNGVSPMAGGILPNQLTPQQKTQTQDYIDPQTGAGQKSPVGQLYDSRGNFVGPNGIPVVRQPGARIPGTNQVQPQADGSVPSGAPTSGGRGSVAPPMNAGTVARPTAPGATAGALPTSLGTAAANDIATSSKEFSDLRSDIAPSRDRVFGLVSALDAIRETNVGPGTATRQKILSAINALPGGVGKTLVPDGSNLSSYDIGKKYLAAARMNRQGAGRSDAALATAGEASPNMDSMSKGAVIDVATSMVGQERMRQAQAIDFINSKRDPGTFSNHAATEYAKSNDPKAFALGVMTPQERASYVSGLKGDARTRFFNGVRMGLSTGVLSRDDLNGAAGGQ